MITEKHANAIDSVIPQPRQLKEFLPWFIGAAGLILYLVTLNRWVTFNNLPRIANASGWTWEPQLSQPLFWLVTYPFRWLPPGLMPLAHNLLSAVCGSLALALLARSVMLLPHDRTHPQRLREKSEYSLLTIRSAWAAPVLAAIVCGLQLTFWEHATTGSSELLDLLIFAYVIRCLLEFRIQERQSWLTRAALVYGLGMTNNWAMIGFFPLFLAAVVWIKGLSFFNLRFLGQMALFGLLGLSLYLVLPLLESFNHYVQVPFWQGLKVNLGGQKSVLAQFYAGGKPIILLLSLTSLVPIFVIAIRWASYFGDTSPFGVAMATIMFHVVHGVLLVACLWVALDPPFSPRNKGFGYPFLTFYYLGALSVGYFTGYFLLLFGDKAERSRRIHPFLRTLNRTVVVAVWVLFAAGTAALAWLNWPQMRVMNGPVIRNYARLLREGLPAEPAVLLSDDLRPLMMLQALVAETKADKKPVFVHTASLKWPQYHKFLATRYPQRWPFDPPKGMNRLLEDMDMFQIVAKVGQSNQLFYLHPTFGYYLEHFYLEPHGLVCKLVPLPPKTLLPPEPSGELISKNEDFWQRSRPALAPLLNPVAPGEKASTPGLGERLMQTAHLTKKPGRDAGAVAGFYARSLDYWGVEMQKHGDLPEAEAHFQTALQLNPENVVAQVNLDCNRQLQSGVKSSVRLSKEVDEAFGKYRGWAQIMGENGPFDEPNFCFEQGRVYFRAKLYRQAAQEFDRVRKLAPDHLPARLWLAELYVLSSLPDAALKMVNEIHAQSGSSEFYRTNITELLAVEVAAHLAKNDDQSAERTVEHLLEKFPNNEGLLLAASQVFLSHGRYSNALVRIDQQLKMNPDNCYLLINKGYAFLQLKDFAQAIPPLTKALKLETNNYSALLNLAIANLGSKNLDAAQQHYETLQKVFPTAFQIYYGLGEIAFLKNDTNAAIRSYQLYLTNSPPGNQEAEFVNERLRMLTLSQK